MRLVACRKCHTQYDVTEVSESEIRCHCGNTVSTTVLGSVDAKIHRCGSCGAAVTPEAELCGYCGSGIVRDESRLSLVCPECYARTAEGSRYCTSCGVEFKPQEILDPETRFFCPCCGDMTMTLRGIGGVRVSECPSCNGLWVPGENFNSLVERAMEAQRSSPSAGLDLGETRVRKTTFNRKVEYRKCPVCEGTMQRKNFGRRSGVIVDWCGKHGTWLDADELEDIASFILSGGLGKDENLSPSGGNSWRLPVDEKRLEAMAAAEKIMARERLAQDKRRRRLVGEEEGVLNLKTLGDVLSSLLGP